jgi:hypothetical protein
MFACAPATDGVIGAAEGVVALVLAAGALSEVVVAEAAFQTVGGGTGRKARSLSDVLCLGHQQKIPITPSASDASDAPDVKNANS